MDAKYKDELAIGDVKRMVTYMLDIATPIIAGGEKLVGILILIPPEGREQRRRASEAYPYQSGRVCNKI